MIDKNYSLKARKLIQFYKQLGVIFYHLYSIRNMKYSFIYVYIVSIYNLND